MENKGDKVSIVIPVYNSEQFLAESIESVLNQTYKNIEIIAVNDGSTDNSLKILEQYSDKITILSQENQGLASALNLGIAKMSGKWFKWFSPDDILKTHAIEILVNQAKTLPENTIVYSNWEIIDENGKKLRSFSESNFNDLNTFDFNIRLLDNQQINVNTSLIPFSLIKRGCTIRNLDDPVVIDYDFFLHAGFLHKSNFYLIEKCLLQYRIHPKQLSHNNIVKTLDFLSNIQDEILSQIDNSTKEKYKKGLTNYRKTKSISKKILELGMGFSKTILPNSITDKLLIFYLNNMRRTR